MPVMADLLAAHTMAAAQPDVKSNNEYQRTRYVASVAPGPKADI
jgi:hypothetical protein